MTHPPKYEPPSGALAPQVRDIRAALRGLKAQQVRSPGQRPGLTYVPHLRPVRAKVKANHSPILLPLQGEGLYTLIPRALPWAGNWLPFQGARGAIRHYSPHPSSPKFVNSCNSLLRRLRPNIFRCNNEPKYNSLFHQRLSASPKFVNSCNSLLRRLRPNIFRCNNKPKTYFVVITTPNYISMFPKLRNLFFHHYLKKCNFASWWRYALISQGVFHCPARPYLYNI